MSSISCHITPLVIDSLGIDTHTKTHIRIDDFPDKTNFKKLGVH